MKGFWYAITVRLPERCEYLLLLEIQKWIQEQKRLIRSHSDKHGIKLQISQGKLAKKINNNFDIFLEELKGLRHKTILDEINKTVSNFQIIANKLHYPQPDDFPSFPNEPIIIINFVEDIKGILLEFDNILLDIFVGILNFVGDRNPENIIQQLENKMQELKKIIKEQKPEILQLMEDMLKQKGANIVKLSPDPK